MEKTVSQAGKTPDEKFLLAVYKAALAKDDLKAEIEIAPLARSLGLREVATGTIVKQLAQANFVQKRGKDSIRLTDRGIAFAEENG